MCTRVCVRASVCVCVCAFVCVCVWVSVLDMHHCLHLCVFAQVFLLPFYSVQPACWVDLQLMNRVFVCMWRAFSTAHCFTQETALSVISGSAYSKFCLIFPMGLGAIYGLGVHLWRHEPRAHKVQISIKRSKRLIHPRHYFPHPVWMQIEF